MIRVVVKEENTVIGELPVNDIGMLGELKVWQKLKELGLECEVFTFENRRHAGHDIKLANGVTVEVKAARRYVAWDMKGTKKAAFTTTSVYAFNAKATLADFVVIYITVGEDEVFYVVPTEMLNKGVNKIYPDATRWKFFKNNWDLIRTKGTC